MIRNTVDPRMPTFPTNSSIVLIYAEFRQRMVQQRWRIIVLSVPNPVRQQLNGLIATVSPDTLQLKNVSLTTMFWRSVITRFLM